MNKLKVYRKSKAARSPWTTAENPVHVPNEVDQGKICTGGQSGTMGGQVVGNNELNIKRFQMKVCILNSETLVLFFPQSVGSLPYALPERKVKDSFLGKLTSPKEKVCYGKANSHPCDTEGKPTICQSFPGSWNVQSALNVLC